VGPRIGMLFDRSEVANRGFMSQIKAKEPGQGWFSEARTNNRRAERPKRMRIKEDAS